MDEYSRLYHVAYRQMNKEKIKQYREVNKEKIKQNNSLHNCRRSLRLKELKQMVNDRWESKDVR